MITTCRICSNSHNNKSFFAEEKMFNTKDQFEYFQCHVCGCVQIKEIPENISDYYPDSYYSFKTRKKGTKIIDRIKNFLIRRYILDYELANKKNIIGFLASKRYLPRYYWLNSNYCSKESKIIDIGCGSGYLISEMSTHGFSNLRGIDPYIEKDIHYSNSVSVERKDVFQLKEKFDFIMLHHSFEHMDHPQEIIHSLYTCLNDNGYVLIRIPIVNYAFEKYGINWFQLDAPRHFFLHTIKSMEILAEKAGFVIENILFDSNESQFIVSEKYQQGYSLNDKIQLHDKKLINKFKKQAKQLNASQKGDQACFYLHKK